MLLANKKVAEIMSKDIKINTSISKTRPPSGRNKKSLKHSYIEYMIYQVKKRWLICHSS